ncbi:MAG: TylF/MycF/NovP-related O-methyltransferase, partial [bacterium]
GGSVMIMAKTLLLFGKNNRKIFMFDTFEGMSNPEDVDKDIENQEAKVLLETSDKNSSFVWSYATENEVRKIYY